MHKSVSANHDATLEWSTSCPYNWVPREDIPEPAVQDDERPRSRSGCYGEVFLPSH
jgi:hypothetical protein